MSAANLFFEDVEPGASFITPTHTVSTDDIRQFCELTHDHHPLHTDEAYAQRCGYRTVIAHGLYGLTLIEGLKTKLDLYRESSLASLGWDKIRFRQPVFAGDTVHVAFRFVDKRLSSKPGRGLVTEALQLVNQDGVVVIEAEHVALLRTRGSD
jgi:acyl dehydratase